MFNTRALSPENLTMPVDIHGKGLRFTKVREYNYEKETTQIVLIEK